MKIPIFKEHHLNRLARRMRAGNEQAAASLYEELVGKVFGFYMNRLRDRALAEDLTQEVFLKVVDRIRTFDSRKGNFSGWFWQLARNTLIDHWRSKKRKEIPVARLPEEREEVQGEEEVLEGKLALETIRRFVETLSGEEQELFDLRFVADLSYREIAKILKKNEVALRVATSRMKQKIRKQFSS